MSAPSMQIDYKSLEQALQHVRKEWPDAKPECGMILGSGWGDVVEGFNVAKTMDYAAIPGLGKTGVVGHSGRLVWGEASGVETLIFQGRRHFYEGHGWTPVAIPVYLLKSLGAKAVILTNAAGGVRADLKPGSLMLITDHINNMSANPLIGPHYECWGPRFPDQSEVYDVKIQRLFRNAAKALKLDLAEGVYLASTGPTYETPAEVRAYKAIGADAVGMSTVPEALLSNAAGLMVGALSCISNAAAGISPHPLTHEEVTETSRQVMPKMKSLILQLWKEINAECL